AETGYGFYPDPVAFGVTPMDRDMLASLQLGWAATDNALRSNHSPASEMFSQGPVVRIVPQFHQQDLMLTGDSAGALFACGLYGTAINERLLHDVSVSCSINATLDNVSDLTTIPVGDVKAVWWKSLRLHPSRAAGSIGSSSRIFSTSRNSNTVSSELLLGLQIHWPMFIDNWWATLPRMPFCEHGANIRLKNGTELCKIRMTAIW
ncbi:MAG: hypothetical protein KDB01_13230, partial [Planctomycetaceae bacterium]|nr:hypothetical protein [Planctomycetaceae bacterium]